MPAPWNARAATGSALVLAACAARGQLLDLGGPAGPPAPGESAVWTEYADRAMVAPSEDHGDPAEQAARSLRRLGAALVREGESRGAEGSVHITLGLTVARLSPAARTPNALAAGGPALRLIAARADRLAARPPSDPAEATRAVRDLLAIAAANTTDAPSSPPTVALAALDADTAAAVRRLDAELTEAARHAAYAPSVAAIRRAIDGAARWLEPLDWITPEAGAAAAVAFAGAITTLAPPPVSSGAESADTPGSVSRAERGAAVDRLRRLALLAEAAAGLDALGGVGAVEDARRAFGARLAAEIDSADTRRLAAAVRRATNLINPRGRSAPGEADLLRPLRPVHRGFVAERRASVRRLTDALPRLASDPDASLAPEIAGVLAQASRAMDDLEALADLSALCERAAFGPRLAVRTLELSRGLSASSRAEIDDALARLRRLVRDAARYGDLPKAARLDAPGGGLHGALGDQAPRVRAAMEDASAALFEAWHDGADAGTLADRRREAEVHRRLADHLADWAALTDRAPAIQRHPLAEFPPEAIGWLRDTTGERLARAVRAAIRRDADALDRALDRAEEADAVLAAASLAASLATPNRARRDPADVLGELVSIGPAMAEHGAADAERARYAAEYALARAWGLEPAPRLTEHVRTLAQQRAEPIAD